MLYLSEDGWDSSFSTIRALSRNRLIHALGEKTFVAQCSYGKGGTWNGTTKNLQHNWSAVYCFCDGSQGQRALAEMGADLVDIFDLADFAALHQPNPSLFE